MNEYFLIAVELALNSGPNKKVAYFTAFKECFICPYTG